MQVANAIGGVQDIGVELVKVFPPILYDWTKQLLVPQVNV